MNTRCPFLEELPQPRGTLLYGCGVGANFYSVGEGQELCRLCPGPALVSAPHCQHLEFYAFLQTAGSGRYAVEVTLECGLRERGLDSIAECEACPDYQEAGRGGLR